jgi:hypothetical protein
MSLHPCARREDGCSDDTCRRSSPTSLSRSVRLSLGFGCRDSLHRSATARHADEPTATAPREIPPDAPGPSHTGRQAPRSACCIPITNYLPPALTRPPSLDPASSGCRSALAGPSACCVPDHPNSSSLRSTWWGRVVGNAQSTVFRCATGPSGSRPRSTAERLVERGTRHQERSAGASCSESCQVPRLLPVLATHSDYQDRRGASRKHRP